MSDKFISVRLRLTLWNVGILALVLLALGAILQYTMQAMLMASMDKDLTLRAARFAQEWRNWSRRPLPGPPPGSRPDSTPGSPRPSPEQNSRVRPPAFGLSQNPVNRPQGPPPQPSSQSSIISNDIFARFWPRRLDTQGRPLLPWSHDTPWDQGSVATSAHGESVFATTTIGTEHARILSIPLKNNEGSIVGVMQVASSLEEMDRALEGLRSTLLILSPLALLACGLGGAFLTGRAMRPVRNIAQASSHIGAGNLSERLQVTGNDEFATLAVTINGMLARLDSAFSRLEQAYEQQRRFTADASHELRTPLTAIKGNVSLALSADRPAAEYREALEATNRSADTMNRIVQDLLFLARSDARQMPMDLRPIDVSELLQAGAEAVKNRDQAAIYIDTADPLPPLCADRSHLHRVLINLLQNALRHTPPEGKITLSASTDGSHVVIRVQDTGEGIPPEHLPHVCERFYRVDAARTRAQGGTGLGLSICKSIVEAHGGDLNVLSTVGQGTTVTIRLPFAESPKVG